MRAGAWKALQQPVEHKPGLLLQPIRPNMPRTATPRTTARAIGLRQTRVQPLGQPAGNKGSSESVWEYRGRAGTSRFRRSATGRDLPAI